MNQDTVKEKLQSIHESPIEYAVMFSMKKSKMVNGLYKFVTKEIVIHNKNFVDDEGKQNETLLMFTAIHELAHHGMDAEKGNKGSRPHTQDFWATFHSLLDITEKKGVYHAEIDADTQKLIDNARAISGQIADLQRTLGRVLLDIGKSCRESGLRTEDVIERKAQISKQSTKVAVAAYEMGDQGVGADIQTEAAKQRDEYSRAAVIAAGHMGKSVVQAKKSASRSKPTPLSTGVEDEMVALLREKRRIERTVGSLTHRLEVINQ
jgi:hypothetical protein